MVSETQLALPLFDAVPNLHGHRIDVGFRLAIDQCPANCAVLAGL